MRCQSEERVLKLNYIIIDKSRNFIRNQRVSPDEKIDVHPGIAIKPIPLSAFIHFCPIYLPPLTAYIGWEASKLKFFQKFLIQGRPLKLQALN